MSTDDNKAVLRRFFEEVVNQGNLGVVAELFPPDSVEPAQQVAAMWRTAFPDLHLSIDDMIAEGDRVAARVTISGTHTGRLVTRGFGEIPPSGRTATWTGVDFVRIVDGKIVERSSPRDLLGMLQQLGVLPQQP